MLLLNSLYKIDSRMAVEGGYDYAISLDPEHFIYKAHFPGSPITPGVCILQIAEELLSEASGRKLEIECVKNVKFLQILVPGEARDVVFSIRNILSEDKSVKAQVIASTADGVVAKISMICRIVL